MLFMGMIEMFGMYSIEKYYIFVFLGKEGDWGCYLLGVECVVVDF